MLDRKRLIELVGPLGLGLGLGCLIWMVVASAGARESAILERKGALPHPIVNSRPAAETADLLAMAIFSAPPVAQEAAGGPTAARPPSTLRLVGISVTPRRRAALISVGGGAAVWVPEGAEGQGYTVDQVTGRSVTLSVSGVAQTLVLFPQAQEATQTDPASPVAATASEASADPLPSSSCISEM